MSPFCLNKKGFCNNYIGHSSGNSHLPALGIASNTALWTKTSVLCRMVWGGWYCTSFDQPSSRIGGITDDIFIHVLASCSAQCCCCGVGNSRIYCCASLCDSNVIPPNLDTSNDVIGLQNMQRDRISYVLGSYGTTRFMTPADVTGRLWDLISG